MDLREALTQIAVIRQQVAQAETFRGYRAAPLALSGALAFVAGLMQHRFLPEPTQHLESYLLLWFAAALVSLLITGSAMLWQCLTTSSALARSLTVLAVLQFLPCLVAGGLVTLVLVRFAPESSWTLPGLWAVLFSLGIFASHRLLPPATFAVAGWYLAAGLVCLAWAQGEHALAPWAMAIPFGIGQLLAAAVLYWNLERRHGEKEGD